MTLKWTRPLVDVQGAVARFDERHREREVHRRVLIDADGPPHPHVASFTVHFELEGQIAGLAVIGYADADRQVTPLPSSGQRVSLRIVRSSAFVVRSSPDPHAGIGPTAATSARTMPTARARSRRREAWQQVWSLWRHALRSPGSERSN